MRKVRIPKHPLNIELDLDMHKCLQAVAAHYGASVRGTIVRYIRDGLINDPATQGDNHSGR